MFHSPLSPGMKGAVHLGFRDSEDDALIHASGIIANQAWYHEVNGRINELAGKLFIVRFLDASCRYAKFYIRYVMR